MREKLYFVRLPLLLVALFFVGRLTLGAAGASYEVGNRLFSMVVLQTHLALLWAAVGRRYRGYRLGEGVQTAVTIVLVSQILVWTATAISYLAGINTFFNYPVAIGGSPEPVSFGTAMAASGRRAGGELRCWRGSRRDWLVVGWIDSSGA